MMKRHNFLLLVVACLLITIGCSKNVKSPKSDGYFIMDMVHNNPAEPPIETSFNNPQKLKDYGYKAMVLNDFKFIHSTIPFTSFDSTLFPVGSKERAWMDSAAIHLTHRIDECHKAGIQAYCFIDIIVLPKKLVEKYKADLCDDEGEITFEKPLTESVHRIMFREIFDLYPQLDGLVIRTGETYLHNVPYHVGNSPITNGPESHVKLINILREEVAEKLYKKVFYRTWDFGDFHVKPDYYLTVTNQIEPHKNLIFSIKHTEGDYHRTYEFNPTIAIGKHKQIIEVQCQREYEGKGAHPNYVMNGVINGFEEYADDDSPKCLNDIKNSDQFAGVWSWSRGGGWVGPYIENELWCDLNAYVISHWVADTSLNEHDIFIEYAKKIGVSDTDQGKFRKLAMLSAKGVVRGHSSLIYPINVWWTRDQFFGGLNELGPDFDSIIQLGLVDDILAEKREAVEIWDTIVEIANEIEVNNQDINKYLRVSSEYGRLKYAIIEQAWNIMLKGMQGIANDSLDVTLIKNAIERYDELWVEYNKLEKENACCATLYKPYSFVFIAPDYHKDKGMDMSIDKFRKLVL